MMAERFVSVVLDGHKGLAFEIPFDPAERWGAAQVQLWPGRRGYRVRGTVNKLPVEGVIVSRARKFFVLVNDHMQTAGELRDGSSVRVSLSLLVT
ncbi:MAG: DUF1905 domain-containing protein [Acidobacteriota bacterium]